MKMFRSLLLGGIAVFGLAPAAPALADSAPSGEVGLYVGGSHWNWAGFGSPTSGGVFAFGGEGRVNVWKSDTRTFQFDFAGEGTTGVDITGPDGEGRISGLLGVHSSKRTSDYLLGVFGGVSASNNLDDRGQMAHYILGLEGQHYGASTTLYFQTGLFGRIDGSGWQEPMALWFGRAAVRHFVSPQTMVSGEFDFATGPTKGNGYTALIFAWRAEVEHMKPGASWSVFARYDGNHAFSTYDSIDGAHSEHQVVVGAKRIFGQPSLLARDRQGATLDMPTAIVRALPYSYVWYY